MGSWLRASIDYTHTVTRDKVLTVHMQLHLMNDDSQQLPVFLSHRSLREAGIKALASLNSLWLYLTDTHFPRWAMVAECGHCVGGCSQMWQKNT